MTERLHFHFSLSCIGEGNGNPFPYSCLENPRDGGAWWAAVYGVTPSQTQLKLLSSSSSRGNIISEGDMTVYVENRTLSREHDQKRNKDREHDSFYPLYELVYK